jgi:hypothetical protein
MSNAFQRDEQLLYKSELSGQLSLERSFNIWKNDMIEIMNYLQHLCPPPRNFLKIAHLKAIRS